MRLTILGSGGIQPDPKRMGPAFLVSHRDSHLLLDAGPGATRTLAKWKMTPAQLAGVCITHRHPDHISELRLILDLERTRGRKKAFALAGPAILDEWLDFYRTWGRARPARFPYPIKRLSMPGRAKHTVFTIEGAHVPHVDHSIGYRITAGRKSLVYLGDCGPNQGPVKLARNADLLLTECTLASGQTSAAHLSPEDAATIARQASARKLVLTHFPPTADVRTAVRICRNQGLETTAARDGMIFDI